MGSILIPKHENAHKHKQTHCLHAAALASLYGIPVWQMDKTHFPHCHTQKHWGFRGRSCLCVYWSEVLSVLLFFIKTNSRLIPREGEESSEHANMLSGLSSQWRIDEHLNHRLLKYDICSSKDHLQQDFIMCGQHTGIRGHHGIHTSTTCRT